MSAADECTGPFQKIQGLHEKIVVVMDYKSIFFIKKA